ncbi:MAG: glutamate racemase [Patescibacteria group bacterium]|nr:glutamate racemase [Patescibacteria group bacterium]
MLAFFDSGFGGLTVYKEVEKLMPEYDYMYLGDGARAPYGNHTPEIIKKYTEEAIEHLFDKGARLIIIACNTASALALRHLQQKYIRDTKATDRNILGVIFPVVEKAVEVSKTGRIGVVGTKGTIESQTYDRELTKLHSDAKIFSKACPLLVPFIEEGWHTKPEARMILKKYLLPLKSKNIDTLVLGCTHYPFMLRDFQRMMGKRTQVLHAGKIVAESLKDYLKKHPELEKLLSKKGKRKFLTTDSTEKFQDFAKKFLKMDVKAEKVEI